MDVFLWWTLSERRQMLFPSGNEIQWYRDGSRESFIVIIALMTISLQFPYLHNKNKDNASVGEMVKLYKGC